MHFHLKAAHTSLAAKHFHTAAYGVDLRPAGKEIVTFLARKELIGRPIYDAHGAKRPCDGIDGTYLPCVNTELYQAARSQLAFSVGIGVVLIRI